MNNPALIYGCAVFGIILFNDLQVSSGAVYNAIRYLQPKERDLIISLN